MYRKKSQLVGATIAALAIGLTTAGVGLAHDSPNEGHIPKDVNYGFEVIGRDTLAGVTDGLYTDVWSHDGYAYIGTFQDPCTDAGVFIVDIDAAIANYPDTEGATVADIKSAPNTRINDVKVHTVGDTDVLIATQEPCGMAIPGWQNALLGPKAKGNGPRFQVGQGGISLYDVTDPTKPKALKKNFLEFEGVHNTFAWDWEGKSYLIGTADTFDFFDTFFVDITKPQSPKLLTITGALDWIPQGVNLDQLETGSSAGIFNHDVWVEIIDGTPTAVVSYWDLGFVTLDVTDPANPVFLDDSTYVDPEPITGQPYEGNAHAAVFGGNGEYIFGGDEDFSPSSFGLSFGGADYPAAGATYGPDPSTLSGELVWSGGEGCTTDDIPLATATGQITLIQRGTCAFSLKGTNAQAQGYEGYVVANDAARGDALVSMGETPPNPTIPGIFVGYTSGEAMKAGGAVAASSVFDGWGYLHVINNTGEDVDVPIGGRASGSTATIPQMGELGYYAPEQTIQECGSGSDGNEVCWGTDFGDLTMHNIEADPLTQDVTPSYNAGPRMFVSWYSLGMRALEYRPGHFHDNSNDEGSYSQNVHEVGRWIAEDGSNFWGVHVDDAEIDGEDTQIILASDRNLGLYVFTFSCDNPDGALYCSDTP